MAKISIIGAGNVGATTAQRLVEKDLADVVLLDIIDGLPQGKALDIAHSAHILGFNSSITGTNDYADTSGSDIVIITSGASRKPGMTRDQLTGINAGIVGEVAGQIKKTSPHAVLLVVTNPVDAMTYLAIKTGDFPPGKVIGLSGALDGSRLAYLLSRQLNVPVTDIDVYVLGEHGQEMVVIPRLNSIRGIALNKMLPGEAIDAIIQKTIGSGAEVINLLKTSSAYYAPSAAVACMAEAVLLDSKRIFTSTVFLQGEYGLKDVALGVPLRLGREGVASIIQLELDQAEKKRLARSARAVKQLIGQLGL